MQWSLTHLSAGGLAAALLAVVALTVLLYFLRLKRRPVAVPFVDLFHELLLDRKASVWRSQLRRWLSMLLSILLVGALVVAFAGPELTPSENGRRTVVLIDAGLSTSEEQIEEAKRVVASWFGTLASEDQMMLIEVGARPRPLTHMTIDRAALSRGLERLELRDVEARFAPAVDLAESVLAAQDDGQAQPDGADREVIWVSSQPPPAGLTAPETTLAYHAIASTMGDEAPGNLAISRFAARRLPRDPSRFEVLVTLQNTFEKSVAVELIVSAADEKGGSGAVLEVKRFSLEPTTIEPPHRVILDNLSNAQWGLVAELRRTDGEEAALRDNRARTTLAANPPLNLLIVGGVDTFLEAALLLDDSLSVRTVAASDYPPSGRFDLTFFNDVFPPRVASTGSAVYLGSPRGETAPLASAQALEMFGFDSWDEDSPIFAALDPYDVQVLQGSSLEPDRGPGGSKDEVLGASAGRPIMVQGEREAGPFVSLGFLPTNSDFVLRPAWPLFVLNLVDALTSRARHEVQTSFQTGETWRVSVADATASHATLRGPLTGDSESVANEGGAVVVSERTVPVIDGRAVIFGDRVGFYELRTPSGTRRFAANLPSRPVAATRSESSVESAVDFSAVAPRPKHLRSEPWFWLLLGVFVVAFAEWWSHHRRWTL